VEDSPELKELEALKSQAEEWQKKAEEFQVRFNHVKTVDYRREKPVRKLRHTTEH
jgi:predicted  nucleic acid-binding Zn-ribbon protein